MGIRSAYRVTLASAAAASVLLFPHGAAAASPSGAEIAERVCTQCHSVQRSKVPGRRGALSFAEIASKPSITDASLRAFLRTSHADMPDYQLTPADLDALVPYILSLDSNP